MLDVLGFGHGQGEGKAEAIVGAEGGAAGFQPFAFHLRLDWVGEEVVLDVGVLLRDHVHMALEDDALAVFEARGCWYAHYDIARVVRKGFDFVVFRPLEEEGADLFLML